MTDKYKIVFEIPTNDRSHIGPIVEAAKNADHFGIAFSICLNGPDFSSSDNFESRNVIASFKENVIKSPCISMMELRKFCAELACAFDPEFRIVADGNFEFCNDWQQYILECCEEMKEFKSYSGSSVIMSMEGSLGGKSWGKKTQIPICPIIPTSRGIIYESDCFAFWEEIEVLPSGFEDHYISSFLIRKMNCVPLKRFYSPIRHPMKRHFEYNDDIHDRSIWQDYNLLETRKLWEDDLWSLPVKHKHIERRGKSKQEEYFYKQPKKSFAFMCSIRDRYMNDPALGRFVTDSYEDRKWRKSRKK